MQFNFSEEENKSKKSQKPVEEWETFLSTNNEERMHGDINQMDRSQLAQNQLNSPYYCIDNKLWDELD